jgi:hypothetical protein
MALKINTNVLKLYFCLFEFYIIDSLILTHKSPKYRKIYEIL